MGYWKSKVLPKIKKVFDPKSGPGKKAAAAEACKAFEESKDEMNKEFEEKNKELHPQVMTIVDACSAEIKAVVKTPTVEKLKKHSTLVKKLLEDLAKIDFPGSKKASEDSTKYGVTLVSTSVIYVFEKVATFIPVEPAAAAPEETTTKDIEVTPPKEEAASTTTTEAASTAVATIEEVMVEKTVEATETTKEETTVVAAPEPEKAGAEEGKA